MKILYLCNGGPDYLADQLYVGLCRVVGVEGVIDYPWKAVYHDPASRVAYLPQLPGPRYTEAEIAAMLRDRAVDLVIFSSPRAAVGALSQRLRRSVSLPPCVLVDGEDDARIRHELVERLGCGLYFKREHRWPSPDNLIGRARRWYAFRENPDLVGRTYPLPFSVILDAMPSGDDIARDVDLSYAARASHPKRVRAWRLLQAVRDLRVEGGLYAEPTDRQSRITTGLSRVFVKLRGDPRVTTAQQGRRLSYEEYHRLLRRSKLALSVRGGGFDTLRYWEIVASGAVLVSERPDIVIPNNFEHGKHALFCRPDLSDLMEVVRDALRDDTARQRIADNGIRHLLRFHTCERRAEYLLDVCRTHL